MAGLTRDNVTARAKGLLNEKADTFWTTTQQQLFADDANRHVFSLLCEVCPEYFITSTAFTWPVNTESLDITGASYLNATPYKLLTIEDYDAAGGISQGNRPRKWERMTFHERARRHAEGYRGQYYFCWQGDRLYVAPLNAESLNVTVHWIPQVTALSAGTTEVLSGLAEPWGDAVAYRLAWLMNAKQSGANPQVQTLWAEAEQRIHNSAYRRTADGPRRVTYGGRRRGWR